jgi:hypothetical protein
LLLLDIGELEKFIEEQTADDEPGEWLPGFLRLPCRRLCG